MLLLYPSDYFDPTKPDDFFSSEIAIAKECGFDYAVFNFEKLEDGKDPFAKTCERDGETSIMRGWQMPSSLYKLFAEYCDQHGFVLRTNAEQYAACHELSNSYPLCASVSPKTVFVKSEEVDKATVEEIFAQIGTEKLFVKDTVKGNSQIPCVITADMTWDETKENLDNLVSDRGNAFTGEFAFREFIELSNETRFFVVDHKIAGRGHHFSDDDVISLEDAEKVFSKMAFEKIDSRFFTIDLARTASGEIVVVETGDGQVSEIPDECMEQVFENLAAV